VSGSYDMSGDLEELAGLVNFRVGAWHDFGYADPPTPTCRMIPPLGERSADGIKAGHGAVQTIDELLRELYKLREALVTELRTDEDIRAARADAILAEPRARRPGWLYGQGCCEHWTPEDGCPQHTGRPAMSLRARELDRPGGAGGAQ
jgi:hypothetical protein